MIGQLGPFLNESRAFPDSMKNESESDSDDQVQEVAGYANWPASKPGQHGTPFLELGALATPRQDRDLTNLQQSAVGDTQPPRVRHLPVLEANNTDGSADPQ